MISLPALVLAGSAFQSEGSLPNLRFFAPSGSSKRLVCETNDFSKFVHRTKNGISLNGTVHVHDIHDNVLQCQLT